MSQTHTAANQPMFNERGLLNANIPSEADIQASMLRQPGQSFEQWMASRVARFETRRYDWDALKFGVARARLDFGPARCVPRRDQCRRRGRADVRDAGLTQAHHTGVPARLTLGSDQAQPDQSVMDCPHVFV